MSLDETKRAGAAAEVRARTAAAEIVQRGTAPYATETAKVIAETATIILTLAEKRAGLVRVEDIKRLANGLPNASAIPAMSDRFAAEHRLAAWVECLVDLATIGG